MVDLHLLGAIPCHPEMLWVFRPDPNRSMSPIRDPACRNLSLHRLYVDRCAGDPDCRHPGAHEWVRENTSFCLPLHPAHLSDMCADFESLDTISSSTQVLRGPSVRSFADW